MSVKLILTDKQAQIVSTACEFYARVKMGQFQEIMWHTLDLKIHADDFCKRRDEAEKLLFEARKYLYPDLNGAGHSYGIGKFEDADKAYDVHQVLRRLFGDQREPFSYHELPKAERSEK